MVLSPLCSWGDEGSERLRHFPEITQETRTGAQYLTISRASTHTGQFLWFILGAPSTPDALGLRVAGKAILAQGILHIIGL